MKAKLIFLRSQIGQIDVKIVVRLLRFALCAVYTIAAAAQTGSSPVLLQDVRLIDGTGAAPRNHVSLLISQGKIARIVFDQSTSTLPKNVIVLKLSGKAVIPGLIAGHAHLGLTEGAISGPDAYNVPNIEHQLMQYERYGVTTMISLGMNKDIIYQLREEQQKGELGGATILTADRGIGTPGGVPAVKVGPDQLYRPATPEAARKDVDEMASRHPDLIKVWVDDNFHTLPEPNPSVYGAVIDEAHKQHLKVAAHVFYLSDAKRLVADGVDILAHSVRDQEVDDGFIQALKQKHVYYIPTLQLEESFFVYADHPAWMDDRFFQQAANPALSQLLNSAAYKQKVNDDKNTPLHKAALKTAMANLKKLHDAGVAIAFGTDSGATPFRIAGWAEHRELQLMVEAGMKPVEAIHSATAVNAEMLQLTGTTGTISEGEAADLVVLDADPSDDILNSERIAIVFHNGREVKR